MIHDEKRRAASRRTCVGNVAGEADEGGGAADEDDLPAIARAGLAAVVLLPDPLVVFGPHSEHGVRRVDAGQVVVAHASFDVLGRDVDEEAGFCGGPPRNAVQRVRERRLAPKCGLDLLL